MQIIGDRRTMLAIAVGGVIGATLRWIITRPVSQPPGGWFAYAPNRSITIGTNLTGFEPTGSAPTIPAAEGIPVGTLLANTLGCLVLGALALLLLRETSVSRRLLVGAATGFCGSLTTFSTFATDIALLLRRAPLRLSAELAGQNLQFERSYGSAVAYLLLSLGAGALAFWLGRSFAQRMLASSEVAP